VNVVDGGSDYESAICTNLGRIFGSFLSGSVGDDITVLKAALKQANVRMTVFFGILKGIAPNMLCDFSVRRLTNRAYCF
jgi:hypothetical protein